MNIKIKKGDYIVVLLIILLSIGIFAFTKIGFNTFNQSTRYVSIKVDGEEIQRVNLTEDTEETIEVTTRYGRNVIEIKDMTARSIEADCPDQLDVLQGAISEPGEMIVCLPNRLLVEIIDVESNSELDVVNQ